MDQSAIVDRASQACADVFRGTPVFLAYAYGSRIEGGMTPASDLDIGYYLATPGALPVAEEMILADRLSRRLGVDVILHDRIPLDPFALLGDRDRTIPVGPEAAHAGTFRRRDLERLAGRRDGAEGEEQDRKEAREAVREAIHQAGSSVADGKAAVDREFSRKCRPRRRNCTTRQNAAKELPNYDAPKRGFGHRRRPGDRRWPHGG
jgi:predicted nucleotidyltransferase